MPPRPDPPGPGRRARQAARRRHPAWRRQGGGAGGAPAQPAPALARPVGPDRGRLPHAVPGREAPLHQLAPRPGPDHSRHVDLDRHVGHQAPRAARQAVPRRPGLDPDPVRARGDRVDRGQLLPQRRLRLRHLDAGPAQDPTLLQPGQSAHPDHPGLGRQHRPGPVVLRPDRDPLGPLALRHQPEHRRRHHDALLHRRARPASSAWRRRPRTAGTSWRPRRSVARSAPSCAPRPTCSVASGS